MSSSRHLPLRVLALALCFLLPVAASDTLSDAMVALPGEHFSEALETAIHASADEARAQLQLRNISDVDRVRPDLRCRRSGLRESLHATRHTAQVLAVMYLHTKAGQAKADELGCSIRRLLRHFAGAQA